MYTIRTGIDINTVKWQNLLDESPFASPFQNRQFYEFCNTTPGYKGYAYAAEDDNGNYQCLCVVSLTREKGLKSWFSRRAIIYGGPLIRNDAEKEALSMVLKAMVTSLSGKAIYIECRYFHDYTPYKSVYEENNWKFIPYLNIQVPLNFKSRDELLASFKYNRRREVRLSIEAGLTYGEVASEQEVSSVYQILKDLYTRQVGLPLPSLKYFEDFRNSGIMKILAVKDGEKVVGGSFCPVLEGKSIYTFYYCGLRDYKPKVYPTHLAVMAAMEYGMNHGIAWLDFMGAGKPDEEYGVRKYKSEFGGEANAYGRYLYIYHPLLYRIGKFVIQNILSRK